MNVAQYVAQCLIERKVRHVFGYTGGAILKLLDEMIATGEIRYVQNYHEQAAAFAADAYSRVTENLGVALATSGPGATNLITGIANAQFDSIPTLFITGQDYTANATRSNGARQNGFQDLDIISVVKPLTKYAVMITDATHIRYEMEKAIYVATSGRPGAVVVDIPIDIQFQEIDIAMLEGFTPPKEAILPVFDTAETMRLIQQAVRPVILLGGGARVAKASAQVQAIAEATGIPVVTTVNGLDLVTGSYGFAGLHGHTFANLAVQNADLLLAFGVRFGQRQVGKKIENYTNAKVVHIDIDPFELQRIFSDELAICADLPVFLDALIKDLAGVTLPSYDVWHETIKKWDTQYRSNTYLNQGGLDPVQATEALSELFALDAIITNDVGQNQMWVCQGYRPKAGQRILNSCGLGSMGYSLPAAIGAITAFPDRQVIACTGDGGLQMNIQEMMFIGLKRVPIKCIVYNNNTLGMMREVQGRYYNAHYYGANPEEFGCVNLEKLAQAYGIGYKRIETLEQIPSLKSCLADKEPYIIELTIPFDSKLSNRYDEALFFERERLHA